MIEMLNLTRECEEFCSRYDPGNDLDVNPQFLPLTSLQAAIFKRFFAFKYWSRCSFEQPRFQVCFFEPIPGESIDSYLRRRAFASGNHAFIPDCETDETHYPEGLDLLPHGQLGIFRESGQHDIVYESIAKILERDALLDRLDVEYLGSVNLKPMSNLECVLPLFSPLNLFPQATDAENVVLCSSDAVCLIQSWHHFYLVMHRDRRHVVRIFGKSPEAFSIIVDKLRKYIE